MGFACGVFLFFWAIDCMSLLSKESLQIKSLGGVIVFLIWAGIVFATLWGKGYQPQPEGRLVSEEELIRMSVRRALTIMKGKAPEIISSLDQTNTIKLDDLVFYDDVDHFLAENPNCCPIEIKWDSDKIIAVSGKIFYKGKDGQIHSSEPVLLLNGQHYPEKLYRFP